MNQTVKDLYMAFLHWRDIEVVRYTYAGEKSDRVLIVVYNEHGDIFEEYWLEPCNG